MTTHWPTWANKPPAITAIGPAWILSGDSDTRSPLEEIPFPLTLRPWAPVPLRASSVSTWQLLYLHMWYPIAVAGRPIPVPRLSFHAPRGRSLRLSKDSWRVLNLGYERIPESG
jgi:hypothetical protein